MPLGFTARFRASLTTAFALSLAACKLGGPVVGEADAHCGSTAIAVDESVCSLHVHGRGDGGVEETPPVRFNDEADDDDCKYHLTFTSTPVRANADVSVTVTVTRKSDAQPAIGADPEITAVLNETHPAPNGYSTTQETSPGTYLIGPMRFDTAGRWTMTFHFYEWCSDLAENSPHGHASFYVDVP